MKILKFVVMMVVLLSAQFTSAQRSSRAIRPLLMPPVALVAPKVVRIPGSAASVASSSSYTKSALSTPPPILKVPDEPDILDE